MRGASKGVRESSSVAPLGPFLLRAALFPLESLEALGTPGSQGYQASLERAQQGLRALVSMPAFREALLVASPSLATALESTRTADKKLDWALLRYVSRMCGRATPYGLFASVSVGHTGERTELQLAPLDEVRKQIEPDIELLNLLVQRWQRSAGVRAKLRYYPTPQLAFFGESLRCVPSESFSGVQTGVVEIARSPHLDALIEASQGGLTIDEMEAVLRPHLSRASEGARRRFIDKLIEAGVLLSELTPASTGEAPLAQLRQITAKIPELSTEHKALEAIRERLDLLEQTAPGAPAERYSEITTQLAGAPLQVRGDTPFHVDTRRPLQRGTLGPAVLKEMYSVGEFLASLPVAPDGQLTRFITQFRERYDTAYVPLMEALDEDHGIGFAKRSFQDNIPLLDGLPFAAPPEVGSFSATEQVLLRKLSDALVSGQPEVVLQGGDFNLPKPSLSQFTLLASLSGHSEEAIARGEFFLYGPSLIMKRGLLFFGRFCRLSAEIEEVARSLAAAEERSSPDLLADLADLPPGRFANVVFHPVLRSHEIVLRGRSGASAGHQINVRDLLVGVEAGRVVLYSQRLGRHVRVRSANAANAAHARTLPVHHFLGAVQQQEEEASGARHLWGPLSAASVLPRLRYGKTILCPATWRLEASELQPWRDLQGQALFEAVQALRESKRWPRWISLSNYDNVLPVDLDNPLSIEMMVNELGSSKSLTVSEYLPALLPCAVRGDGGSFAHEVVVPFVSAGGPVEADTRAVGRATSASERAVSPGRSPLYARIYGSPEGLESFLLGTLTPLLSQPEVERWFFVRYVDSTGPHLRLRVFGDPKGLWGPWRAALSEEVAQSIQQGELQRLVLDTYRPEIERYGGPQGVGVAERIFCVDSAIAVEMLSLSRSPEDRWRMVALGADAYLADFGLALPERLAWAARCALNYFNEFRGQERLSRALGEQFRELKGPLADAFTSTESPWPQARKLLEERSRRLQPLVAELKDMWSRGQLTRSPEDLLDSYVHLSNDRMFERALRQQEMVLFAFLERRYRAMQARAR